MNPEDLKTKIQRELILYNHRITKKRNKHKSKAYKFVCIPKKSRPLTKKQIKSI